MKSKNESTDLALVVLLSTREKLKGAELSTKFIEACYEIQRKHQFDDDGSAASLLMEKLIDEEVGRMISPSEKI